jgi:uncharacterized RDD family membrane protein YckC
MSATTIYNPPLRTSMLPPAGTLPLQQSQYAKAPLGSRILAHLIDTLIALAGLIPGGLLLIAVADQKGTLSTVALIVFGVGLAWVIGYSFAKDGARGGASLGKRYTGLMVVHLATGRPCSKAQSVLRAGVLAACGHIPMIGFLIEPLYAFSNDEGRRIGDRAAGTQVIRASDYRTLNSYPLRRAA